MGKFYPLPSRIALRNWPEGKLFTCVSGHALGEEEEIEEEEENKTNDPFFKPIQRREQASLVIAFLFDLFFIFQDRSQ